VELLPETVQAHLSCRVNRQRYAPEDVVVGACWMQKADCRPCANHNAPH